MGVHGGRESGGGRRTRRGKETKVGFNDRSTTEGVTTRFRESASGEKEKPTETNATSQTTFSEILCWTGSEGRGREGSSDGKEGRRKKAIFQGDENPYIGTEGECLLVTSTRDTCDNRAGPSQTLRISSRRDSV